MLVYVYIFVLPVLVLRLSLLVDAAGQLSSQVRAKDAALETDLFYTGRGSSDCTIFYHLRGNLDGKVGDYFNLY